MTSQIPTSDKVPVLQCTNQAYQFLAENWLRFLPASFVVGAVSTSGALLSTGPVAQFGFSIVSILVGLAFAAAVVRKQLSNEYRPPIGMTLGADEFRLFAVTIAVVLMLVPAGFLLFSIGTAVLVSRLDVSETELERLSTDPEALRSAILGVIGPGDFWLALLLAVPMLWLAARFFLVNPGTIGEARIIVLESWQWTRGNVGRIMVAMIIVAAPLVGFNVLLFLAPLATATTSLPVSIVIMTVVGAASALLRIPLISLSTILYRGLRPPDRADDQELARSR